MLTEDYIKQLNDVMLDQAVKMLRAQKIVATAYFVQRTGQLLESTSQNPSVANMHLSIDYPLHIRFLDLKKTKSGHKKRVYEPIYNKYIYGYLYAGIYNRIKPALSGEIRRTVVETFKNA